ncbi:MAG TPA: EamA family transporter, partial [Thermomicrobiales bacterium]|nr:EamA family transporter [Thermomicrobiales bacterium]
NGALSLTYPVARGTGVLLVPLLAMPVLGERLTPVAGIGIVAILAGIVALNLFGNPRGVAREVRESRQGLTFAVLTGLAITTYSLIDKAGIVHVHPLIYVYLLVAILTLGIAPWVLLRRRAAVRQVWRTARRAAVIAGVLNMGTYLIVLAAMRVAGSSVSYIVPLRETSIVFATIMGAVVLGEHVGRPRLASSALIAAGVIAIALGS